MPLQNTLLWLKYYYELEANENQQIQKETFTNFPLISPKAETSENSALPLLRKFYGGEDDRKSSPVRVDLHGQILLQ